MSNPLGDGPPSAAPQNVDMTAMPGEVVEHVGGGDVDNVDVHIDPEVQAVTAYNPNVAKFLEKLQSISITENCVLGSQFMFYVWVVAFMIPSAWSIASAAIVSLPERIYYDGCHSSNSDTIKYPFSECFKCCNDRSSIFTGLVPIPETARALQIVTIVVASVVAAASAPVYARLIILENMAITLLSFGVVVKSKASCMQYLSVIVFGLLFCGIAALYTVTRGTLAGAFSRIFLGFGDVCDAGSPYAGQKFVAEFNADNPSLKAADLPSNAFDYVKAFALILVPFIPVWLKFLSASSSTFSRLGLEDMITDNVNSAQTFDGLHWEVDENVLVETLEEYAPTIVEETSDPWRCIRRIVVCDWEKGPIPSFFLTNWAVPDEDPMADMHVHRVLTLIKAKGELNLYKTEKEKDA